MPSRVCAHPGCPRFVTHRGRCASHQHETGQALYRGAWRHTSQELRKGARCASCGTTRGLTVDHVEPHSLAAGLRVLCRSCHARIGRKRDDEPGVRDRGRTNLRPPRTQAICAPFFRAVRPPDVGD